MPPVRMRASNGEATSPGVRGVVRWRPSGARSGEGIGAADDGADVVACERLAVDGDDRIARVQAGEVGG